MFTAGRVCRAVLGALVVIGACTAPRSSEDPFAGAGSRAPRGERLYIVQLQVRCDECTVTYQVAGSSRSVRAFNPGWNVTLRLFPRFSQRISLSATGSVELVRILVDGEVVASAEADGAEPLPLSVVAVIPPPASPAEPDSSATEGRPAVPSTR